MKLIASGYAYNDYTFLDAFSPLSGNALSKLIARELNPISNSTSFNKIVHGIEVEFTINDPGGLSEQLGSLIEDILAGGKPPLMIGGELVDLFTRLHQSSSVVVNSLESNNFSLSVEGSLGIGGGLNGGVKSLQKRPLYP